MYDTDKSVFKPVDKIPLAQLPARANVFGFLRPVPVAPVFGADAEDVTAPAAENVAAVFNSLVKNGTPRENALRYCLQCIIALFAEDVDLLPDHLFTRLINDCSEKKGNSYDLIGGLFQEMNREGRTPAGRYKDVDYFNGGLFAQTNPIELNDYQISLLQFAAKRNWRNVNPSIFGSIFKAGLEKGERHLLGQHYTREIDIKKIVDPVIVQPWSERIEAAETLDDLNDLLNALCRFRVLDPACGSGNFLFMAFREMKLLEKCLLTLVRDRSTTRDQGRQLRAFLETYPFVNTQQFYGIDVTTAPSKSRAKTPPHPPRNPGQSGARCLWFCPGHRPAHAQPRNRRA
ncbi:MAG TPA: type IIL restriction-modification enzyme MmeI, partial [Spirosoma sp.]|nr:type IIL restriction-modification enzyme MmeI [Spirosoma sp.]